MLSDMMQTHNTEDITSTRMFSTGYSLLLPPGQKQREDMSKNINDMTTFTPTCFHNVIGVSWTIHLASKFISYRNITMPTQIIAGKKPVPKPVPKITAGKQPAPKITTGKQPTPKPAPKPSQIEASKAELNDALIECVSLSMWQTRHFCKGMRFLQAAMYSKRREEEKKREEEKLKYEQENQCETIATASPPAASASPPTSASPIVKSPINQDAFTFLRHARVTFKRLSLYSPLAQFLCIESTLFLAAEAALVGYKDKVDFITDEAMKVFERFFVPTNESEGNESTCYKNHRPLKYLSYSDGIARAFNNIGNTYENEMENFEVAYKYKKQSLECFKLYYNFAANNRPKDNMIIAAISTNLGLMLLDVINSNSSESNEESHEDALNLMRDGVNMMRRHFQQKRDLQRHLEHKNNRTPIPDYQVVTDDDNERYASALNSLGGCIQQTHTTTNIQIENEAIPFLREALEIRQKLWSKEKMASANTFIAATSTIHLQIIATSTNLGNALGFTANYRGEGIEKLRLSLQYSYEAAEACEKLFEKKLNTTDKDKFYMHKIFRGYKQRLAMSSANLGSALMEVPSCQVESQDHVQRAIDIYEKLISTLSSTQTTNTEVVRNTFTTTNAKMPTGTAATTGKTQKDSLRAERIRLSESHAVSILNLGLLAEKLDGDFDRALKLKKQALELRFKCFLTRTKQESKVSIIGDFDIDKMIVETDDNKIVLVNDATIAANLCNVGESLAFHGLTDDNIATGIKYLRKSIEILERIGSNNCNKLLAVASLLPHLEEDEAESLALKNLSLLDAYIHNSATFHRIGITKAFADALKNYPELFHRINLMKLAAIHASEAENKRISRDAQEVKRRRFFEAVAAEKEAEKKNKTSDDSDENSDVDTEFADVDEEKDEFENSEDSESVDTERDPYERDENFEEYENSNTDDERDDYRESSFIIEDDGY